MTGWGFDPTRTRNTYNSVFIFQTFNREARMSKGIQVHHHQSVCLRSEETGGYCLLQEHTRQEALCTIPQNLLNQRGISETIKITIISSPVHIFLTINHHQQPRPNTLFGNYSLSADLQRAGWFPGTILPLQLVAAHRVMFISQMRQAQLTR